MRRIGRLAVIAVLPALLVLVPPAPIAEAGGSWFDPVADRYEPGEEATLVGYSGGGSLGSTSDGPFFGYLYKEMDDYSIAPRAIPLPLGEIDVSSTGHPGYLGTRAAITFEIPDWVTPGIYRFEYCNEACDKQLGDLIGGRFHIGIDAEYPVTREWALDEPEIANLADDALISGPGSEITAATLRDQ